MLSAVLTRLLRMRHRDEGATMVEYGLLVALIAGVAVVALTALGGQVRDGVDKTCKPISTGVTSPAPPVTC